MPSAQSITAPLISPIKWTQAIFETIRKKTKQKKQAFCFQEKKSWIITCGLLGAKGVAACSTSLDLRPRCSADMHSACPSLVSVSSVLWHSSGFWRHTGPYPLLSLDSGTKESLRESSVVWWVRTSLDVWIEDTWCKRTHIFSPGTNFFSLRLLWHSKHWLRRVDHLQV